MRRAIPIVLVLAALQLTLVMIYRCVSESRNSATVGALRVGRVALPAQKHLLVLNAQGTRQAITTGERATLLHFWATWCPACKEEMPRLLAFGRELEQRHELRLVLVAMDKEWNAVRGFFSGAVPAQVVRDEGSLATAFGVSKLPATFLLDEGGAPRMRFEGAQDWSAGEARTLVTDQAKIKRQPP